MAGYTARAEGLGRVQTGLFVPERKCYNWPFGLYLAIRIWALALLAVFSQVTAIERIVHVWRITSRVVQIRASAASVDVSPKLLIATGSDNLHVPTTTT